MPIKVLIFELNAKPMCIFPQMQSRLNVILQLKLAHAILGGNTNANKLKSTLHTFLNVDKGRCRF